MEKRYTKKPGSYSTEAKPYRTSGKPSFEKRSPASHSGYAQRPVSSRESSSRPTAAGSYKPHGAGVPVRPTSTGYVKKTYTPRPPEEGAKAAKPYVRSISAGTHFSKAGFSERKTYAPRKDKESFAKKPYAKKSPSMSRFNLDKRGVSGEKKAYLKRGDAPFKKAGYPKRDAPAKKPYFKSVVPNKPKTAKASWGAVASWYDEHLNTADTYHEKVILPNLLRLIDPKKGDTILDLACGQGYFARALDAKGASVTGIDIAEELITIAKKESPTIPYHVASTDDLSPFHDGTFAKALISLAIQNIEHVEEALTEAARVLAPAGTLHIVMNHPAFRIPKASSWQYDTKKNVQFRRIDGYLSNSKSAIAMHPGFADSPETLSFHRPLQFYFKALRKAGFAVGKLEEWISHKESDSGPRARAENNARKEIPLFLYLEAIKQ